MGGIWSGGVFPGYDGPELTLPTWSKLEEPFFVIPENADAGAYVSVYNGYERGGPSVMHKA